MGNPYASVDCHFCNGKGCFCAGALGKHEPDCVPCDICETTGQLGVDQLNQMAKDYKADEYWKRAFKSAVIVLICFRFMLGI